MFFLVGQEAPSSIAMDESCKDKLMCKDERKSFGAPPGGTVNTHEGTGSYYR